MILDIQSHTFHFIHVRYASIPRANIYLFDLKLISQLYECQDPNKIQPEDCSVRLHNIVHGNWEVILNVKNVIVWQGISFKMYQYYILSGTYNHAILCIYFFMEGYRINFTVQSRLTTIFFYKSIASAQSHSYAMSFLFVETDNYLLLQEYSLCTEPFLCHVFFVETSQTGSLPIKLKNIQRNRTTLLRKLYCCSE